jgi:hypothetical protein
MKLTFQIALILLTWQYFIMANEDAVVCLKHRDLLFILYAMSHLPGGEVLRAYLWFEVIIFT